MIKTVRECDYCQDQTTVNSMTEPTMPEGWQKVLIMVTNHLGECQTQMSYEICDKHGTLSTATIVGTLMA